MIPSGIKTNFETLKRAAENGDLALMECVDAITGEPRYVLCAVHQSAGEYVMSPFGHLCTENPYEVYLPPLPAAA